jgi:hypothetical protein
MFNFAKNTEGVLKITIMAYRDFKMSDLTEKFGIVQLMPTPIFNRQSIKMVEPSAYLKMAMQKAELFELSTEKAISERLVSPILAELKERNPNTIKLFSGEIINADVKVGLNGEIDFILTKHPESIDPRAPILCITEAKIGKIQKYIPQAVAQMIGARVFNAKNKEPIDIIYGAVTDGKVWRFLKLEKAELFTDDKDIFINELPLLLGALQFIVDSNNKN